MVDFRKAEVADTVCPNRFSILILVTNVNARRCAAFKLASALQESAVVPFRGMS